MGRMTLGHTIDNTDILRDWFLRSGVRTPLRTCIGPLPGSRASLVRWSAEQPDSAIQTVSAHLHHYRVAVMLEPVEARIWSGKQPVWGGVIGAERFRICPPGAASQWSRLSSCDIVNLFLPVALIDSLSAQRQAAPPATLAASQFSADRQVMQLIRHMLDAERMAGPLQQQFCDALVLALSAYLLEHYSTPAASQAPSTLGGARLRKVVHHMQAHLADDNVSNASLAALCGMSEAHFSREFHRALGMPPHRYMLRLRLEAARTALLEGKARVIDIAHACGFHDASHFSRSFSQYHGVAPAAFRTARTSSTWDIRSKAWSACMRPMASRKTRPRPSAG
jgi:AraC family transcriptional regulator